MCTCTSSLVSNHFPLLTGNIHVYQYLIKQYIPIFRSHLFTIVTGERGNVEINNSFQTGIELRASRFKIQHSTKLHLAKLISH